MRRVVRPGGLVVVAGLAGVRVESKALRPVSTVCALGRKS
jgi:hypothetical protein